MSEQDKSSEQHKYSVSIEQAKGVAIGDNPRVNIFYVNEPSTSHPLAGPRTSPPISREELLRLVHVANNELRDYPNRIAGEHLTRPEVAEILEWVVKSDPAERLGMILDQPGGGKTVVMRDVLEELEAAGIPVLAIKADVLSGVDDASSLGRRLGLPMSVEDCARYLADEGLFVVVLDQIDALSMVLSRDQATLDAVLSSVSRLRNISNVRLLASCRTFDLHHDPRLSAIKVDREFELRALTEEQVSAVQCWRLTPPRLKSKRTKKRFTRQVRISLRHRSKRASTPQRLRRRVLRACRAERWWPWC